MNKFYKLQIYIYYIDFFISACLFIGCFYLTFVTGNLISLALSCIFLYRVGAFTHEICHQYPNPKIKLFKFLWDLTAGCLMLQPSLRFKSPHLQHHKVGIFATELDPQYPLIFSNTKLAVGIFILLPFLMPIYNLVICLIPFKNNNLKKMLDKTLFNKKEQSELFWLELYYIFVWALAAYFYTKILLLFYVVSVGAWLLSVIRIPLEHPLNEYKKTSVFKDQEVLSYTHELFIYAVVQPLGLRFHKAHHMYPKVPYYNLNMVNKELKN